MKPKRNSWPRIVAGCAAVVLVALAFLPIQGTGAGRWLWLLIQPTGGRFQALPGEPRVLYEPGAEKLAQAVAAALPGAIKTVERNLRRPFPAPIRIHVCASMETFSKYMGHEASAAVANARIFFSPRQAERLDRIPSLTAHELVHFHEQSSQGMLRRLYRSATSPLWLREGLAVWASDGGGADYATESEARAEIAAGNHIFKSPITPGRSTLSYYRQSYMFLLYLRSLSETKFHDFIADIETGLNPERAFIAAFDESAAIVSERWVTFQKELAAGEHTTANRRHP